MYVIAGPTVLFQRVTRQHMVIVLYTPTPYTSFGRDPYTIYCMIVLKTLRGILVYNRLELNIFTRNIERTVNVGRTEECVQYNSAPVFRPSSHSKHVV